MRLRTATIISITALVLVIVAIFVRQSARRGAEATSLPASSTPTPLATAPPQSPAPTAAGMQTSESSPDPFELLRSGKYTEAADIFRNRLNGDDSPAVSDSVGLIRCAVTTGDYKTAEQTLESVTRAGTTDADVQYWAARLAFVQGQYARTIERCRDAIRLDRPHAPARLLLAQTLELTGQRDEALNEYQWFDRVVTTRLPEDAEQLTAVGQGFYRYSVLTQHPELVRRTRHVLNKVFQVAGEHLGEAYRPARVATGDLLREKYNLDEARTEYLAALDINTNCAEAMVGLGYLALEQWEFEAIDKQVDGALRINPRHAGALHLQARCRLLERRYPDAVDACNRALEVNPNDVEALSLAAAAYRAMYDDNARDAMIARVEGINPECGLLHQILGDVLGGLRQYAESEKHYLRAISLEPSAPLPRIELGLMYMQWGDEDKARKALDDAWRLDPFNELTKNTLDLLDRLTAFDKLESEHFVIHFDAEKDALLAPMIQQHLESVYPRICERFGAMLDRKTIIEVFPAHSQFGVRVTGKPWIHTVGACTGWIIAIDSPRRGPDLMGPYDLANVLTHEFTHTVTLAVTGNRVPHWMTEGLAVLVEEGPKSYSWMELLARAIRRGDLFTLESIDWGFMRPKKPWHRPMAYAQSEWMCEYLIQTRGEDVIKKMLAAFADGQSQKDVFEHVVGVSQADFDTRFAAWAKNQAAANWAMDVSPVDDVDTIQAEVDRHDTDADLWARLARARYDAQDVDAAIDAARKCIKLAKDQHPAALRVLTSALMDRADGEPDPQVRAALRDDALDAAERLIKLRENDDAALKILSRIYIEREFTDLAEEYLLRLQKVQPHDPFASVSLAGLYLARHDDEAALAQLLGAADLGDHDAQVRLHISEIYARRNQLDQAESWLSDALMIDPYSVELRTELAQVLSRMGRTADAADQYRILCDLAPRVAQYWSRAAMTYHQIGNNEAAVRCAKRAVKLDPDSPVRTLLD